MEHHIWYYGLIASSVISALGYITFAVSISTNYYVIARSIHNNTECQDSRIGFWEECVKACDERKYTCSEKEVKAIHEGLIIAALVLAAVGFVSLPVAVCECNKPAIPLFDEGVIIFEKRGPTRMILLTVLALLANLSTVVLGLYVVLDFKKFSEDRLKDRSDVSAEISIGSSFVGHLLGCVIILIVSVRYVDIIICISYSSRCCQGYRKVHDLVV